MAAKQQAMNLVRGKTFQLVIRWEDGNTVVAKPITAISYTSGFPRLTVTSHGLTSGWQCYVAGVDTPKQINTENVPPRTSDLREATVIDSGTVELNGVLPVDESGRVWSAYTSGGFLYYNAVRSLSGAVVRAKVKDKVGGTVLLSTEVEDSPLDLITATVDDATKTILIEVDEATTEALLWSKGVWEVEVEVGGNVFSLIPPSPVTVGAEVVTNP